MANFTAGTSFSDGVTNDVTAAKLNALVADAVPTVNLSLNSTTGTIATFNSTTGTITGLRSTTGTVATLNSTTGTITGLNSTNGTVATLNSTTGTITGLNSTNGTVATLNSTTGTITNLNSTTGTVATFNSTTGTIPTLTSITKITSGTGTAAAPAISPTGDTNTGVFFPAADTIAFAEGGAEAMRIDSSGNLLVGTVIAAGKLVVKADTNQNLAINSSVQITDSVAISAVNDVVSANIPLEFRYLTNLGFFDSGTERMRISSGNVGIGVSTPVNKLEVVGSLGRGAPVVKTADFTLAATENWIIVNKATTSCTATLPAASSWTGREFTIKTLQALTVVSASSNVIPIDSATNGTAILPATPGSWATLVSNGNNWVTMAAS